MMGGVHLRAIAAALAALFACCVVAPAGHATERSAASLAHEGRAECEEGRRAESRDEREQHFTRGRKLAEKAIALDDGSAAAHFALFCNLGELMRLDGETLSSVFALRHLMNELDRTLALDPGNTDALAAKGTLLIRLPRLLGGDPEKGEQLLRQVIEQDPNAFSSRLTLAKTCEARGERDEALAFARRALQVARAQGRADKIAEAQAALAELGAGN
jgi:tetratricopeptide (TPR) repeat protein